MNYYILRNREHAYLDTDTTAFHWWHDQSLCTAFPEIVANALCVFLDWKYPNETFTMIEAGE